MRMAGSDVEGTVCCVLAATDSAAAPCSAKPAQPQAVNNTIDQSTAGALRKLMAYLHGLARRAFPGVPLYLFEPAPDHRGPLLRVFEDSSDAVRHVDDVVRVKLGGRAAGNFRQRR